MVKVKVQKCEISKDKHGESPGPWSYQTGQNWETTRRNHVSLWHLNRAKKKLETLKISRTRNPYLWFLETKNLYKSTMLVGALHYELMTSTTFERLYKHPTDIEFDSDLGWMAFRGPTVRSNAGHFDLAAVAGTIFFGQENGL